MDRYASEQMLRRDLEKLHDRFKRQGIEVEQDGLDVAAVLIRRRTGDRFRLLCNCEGYPFQPLSATFVAQEPEVAPRWPADGEYTFRIASAAHFPFICLPGLMSYAPEGVQADNPYSKEDLRIGAVLGRVMDALNAERCTGMVYWGM